MSDQTSKQKILATLSDSSRSFANTFDDLVLLNNKHFVKYFEQFLQHGDNLTSDLCEFFVVEDYTVSEPNTYSKDYQEFSLIFFDSQKELQSLRKYLSLYSAETESGEFFQLNALKWLIQLAQVLVYLHELKIVHGNLTTR